MAEVRFLAAIALQISLLSAVDSVGRCVIAIGL